MMSRQSNMTAGQRIRQERQSRSWSQKMLADRIETTVLNINRWEHDKTLPQPHHRARLCEAFQKSPEELFGTQPLGEEEPPAPIWHVPYLRNRYFTGRASTLEGIRATLLHHDQIGIFPAQVALSGMGGIGKTQTALEYAYRHRDEYTAVLWAQADTREDLLSQFIVLAATVDLPEKDLADHRQIVTGFIRWLRIHDGWLLILDNVDDLAIINEFLPGSGKGHILFTTRTMATGQHIEGIEIEKMEHEDAVLLLLRRAKMIRDSSDLSQIAIPVYEQARTICTLVDALPLALEQAAAYVEENAANLADYLSLFQAYPASLLRRRGALSQSDYAYSVATTWALSFRKIEQANPVAANLLRLCSFLQPDAISEQLLLQGAADLGSHLRVITADPLVLYEVIGELRKYSLIRRNAETKMLSIHRLVQMILRDTMTQEEQRLWAEQAVGMVNCAFPDLSEYEVSSWAVCQLHLPQALHSYELIKEWQMVFPEAARLLDQIGVFLRDHARYTEAEALLRDALAMREQLLGATHPLVAQSLNNLATLYWELGRYGEAETLFQRALTLREQRSASHLEKATSLNNLALVFYAQKKFREAEPLLQRAQMLCEEALANTYTGHLETTDQLATCLNNLGLLYYGQGKYQDAEPFYQRALALWEELYRQQHPKVATSLNNLGRNYQFMELYELSERHHQRALMIREQILGSMHPYTAISLNNLALLYCAQKRYDEAEPLFQRALHIRETSLGSTHVDVATVLENLALLLRNTTRQREAQALEERAASIRNGRTIL